MVRACPAAGCCIASCYIDADLEDGGWLFDDGFRYGSAAFYCVTTGAGPRGGVEAKKSGCAHLGGM